VPYTILEANSRRRAKTGCEKLWISIEVKASSTTKFGAEKKQKDGLIVRQKKYKMRE